MAALQHVGLVHRRPACRIHGYCGPHRSIQRIRTNRIQSVRSALSMGKQFTRLLCRAYRQLRVLFHRRVAEKHTHFYHCPRHIRLVTYISMENGRTYCNTICPVGTVLGLLSRFSLFRPVIDTTKCNGCQSCARNCKASCIDAKNHLIDYSRCVACMDCIEKCRQGAIRYIPRKKTTSASVKPAHEDKKENPRREFLSFAGLLAGTALLKAQEKKVDGGLAVIEDKKFPTESLPLPHRVR